MLKHTWRGTNNYERTGFVVVLCEVYGIYCLVAYARSLPTHLARMLVV